MGPGQYPQYTRVWSARKAVGSSQTTHHSTPPPHRMSPTSHVKSRNRASFSVTGEFFSKSPLVDKMLTRVFSSTIRNVIGSEFVQEKLTTALFFDGRFFFFNDVTSGGR